MHVQSDVGMYTKNVSSLFAAIVKYPATQIDGIHTVRTKVHPDYSAI